MNENNGNIKPSQRVWNFVRIIIGFVILYYTFKNVFALFQGDYNSSTLFLGVIPFLGAIILICGSIFGFRNSKIKSLISKIGWTFIAFFIIVALYMFILFAH